MTRRRRARLGLALWTILSWTALGPIPAAAEDGMLRIAQLWPGTESVAVSLESADHDVTLGPLSSPRVGEYRSVPPGVYDVTVRRDDRTLMEARYGIGGDRHYTLVLYGIPTPEAPQPETLWKKLRSWFSGSEVAVPNGWVAQHRMLLDSPGRTLGRSRVRILHAVPGWSTVHVELRGSEETLDYGTLGYPQVGSVQEVAPGEWTAVVRPPSSPLNLLEKTFRAEPDRLVTLFLTGSVEPAVPPRLVVAPSGSN